MSGLREIHPNRPGTDAHRPIDGGQQHAGLRHQRAGSDWRPTIRGLRANHRAGAQRRRAVTIAFSPHFRRIFYTKGIVWAKTNHTIPAFYLSLPGTKSGNHLLSYHPFAYLIKLDREKPPEFRPLRRRSDGQGKLNGSRWLQSRGPVYWILALRPEPGSSGIPRIMG